MSCHWTDTYWSYQSYDYWPIGLFKTDIKHLCNWFWFLLNTEDYLWLYFMNFFLYAFGKCRDADFLGWLFRCFSPFKSFWNVSVDAEIDHDQVWCSFIGSNLGLITIDSIFCIVNSKHLFGWCFVFFLLFYFSVVEVGWHIGWQLLSLSFGRF